MIFNIIKEKNTNANFKNFLNYFGEEDIKKYNILSWNYYLDYRHLTNNAYESYNASINKWFLKKPTFFRLLYELQIEENIIVTTYMKRLAGLLGHEYRRKLYLEERLTGLSKSIETINNMPDSTSIEKRN